MIMSSILISIAGISTSTTTIDARRHIQGVVDKRSRAAVSTTARAWPSRALPLINSEYGAVSAGGGDRDISWGLRDLTTQLRRQRKIQGFVYTELADIEWEHNGLVNYDRTPKAFGYDRVDSRHAAGRIARCRLRRLRCAPGDRRSTRRNGDGPDLCQPFFRPPGPRQIAVVGQWLRFPRRHPDAGGSDKRTDYVAAV